MASKEAQNPRSETRAKAQNPKTETTAKAQNPKTETSSGKKGEDSKEKSFADECMAITNKYRALHQAAPLVYSQDLERMAKQWSEYLSHTNNFMHNPHPVINGKEVGENIASRWSTDHEPISALQTVNQWYSEIERYNFKTNAGPNTGHFTQVVWKDSKESGLWRTQMKDGTWIVVAYYYPAGNYVGEYSENVLPTKDGKFGHLIDTQSAQPQRQLKPSSGGGGGATEKKGNVTRTVRTQTVTHSDGSVTTTVTETIQGPGPETRTKIVETTKKPDGSTTTDTTEKFELGSSK